MGTDPDVEDFVITESIDGGEGLSVTPSDVALDETGTIVTLAVPEVVATAQDQSVVYSVSYKGGDTVASDPFTVDGTALAVSNVQVPVANNTKLATVTATVKNAEEAATAKVEIFGYDEEGVLKETADITIAGVAIAENAIEVEIDVAALESGDYVAVVTVGEVNAESAFTVDFAAVDAAVAAVNLANTEPKLWTALQNELFTGAKISLITDYRSVLGVGNEKATVKAIQDSIDSVNDSDAIEVLLGELDAAPNQIELLALLEANFERVNGDWINEYPAARATNYTSLATKAAVQGAIDTANEAEVGSLIDAAEANVTAEKYTAAISALVFVKEDTEGVTVKADMVEDLQLVEALLGVINAKNSTELLTALKSELLETTSEAVVDELKELYYVAFAAVTNKDVNLNSDAKIKAAIIDQGPVEQEAAAVAAVEAAANKTELLEKMQALAAISAGLDADTIIAGLADDYWAKFETLDIEAGDINAAAKVQSVLVDVVNAAELTAAVDAFEALTGGEALDPDVAEDRATFIGYLERLAVVVNDAETFDYADVDANIVKEYMIALKIEVEKDASESDWAHETIPATDEEKVGIVATVVSDQNDVIVDTRLGLVAAYTDDDADELLALLQDNYIKLGNVLEANKDAYLAELALLNAEAGVSVDQLKAAVDVTNKVVSVNAATDSASMKIALVNFVNASQNLTDPEVNTVYLLLSSTVKSEVAQLVLADRAEETDGVFADKAAVIASLGATDAAGAISAHADLVGGINDIAYDDNIVTVGAALTAFGYDAYDAFEYNARLEIAEIFFTNLGLSVEKENPNFTTFSGINAAIDAAIAEFQAR